MRKFTDQNYMETILAENQNLKKEILTLQEENNSLKRENNAYYDTLYAPTTYESCVENETEPISPLEQKNIDYEKRISELNGIIQILLA